MKRVDQKRLKEMLRLHSLWLNDRTQGAPALFNSADIDISGANFKGKDLRRATFTGQYRDINFKGANLREAQFIDLCLAYTSFTGANLSLAEFTRCEVNTADFFTADMERAILEHGRFLHCNMRSANLKLARLGDADFYRCIFIDANLESASLCGAGLIGTQLRGAILKDADFRVNSGDAERIRRLDLPGIHIWGLDDSMLFVNSNRFTVAEFGWTLLEYYEYAQRKLNVTREQFECLQANRRMIARFMRLGKVRAL